MSRARSSLSIIYVLGAALAGALQAEQTGQAPRAASFAYVANERAGTVSAFRIDASTGALASIDRTGVATDKGAYALTIDAARRRVYVAHGEASSIVGLGIDPTRGGLQP